MRKRILTGLLLTLALLKMPAPGYAQENGQEQQTDLWLDQLRPSAAPTAKSTPDVDVNLQWYQQQIKEHPEQAALHYQLGLLHQQARRWPEAEAAFQAALKINPRLYPVIYQLAQVLLERDQPEAALKLVNQALKTWRVDPNLYHAKGLAHWRLKQEAWARSAFHQALVLDANHPAAQSLAALSQTIDLPIERPSGSEAEAQLAKARSLFMQKNSTQALARIDRLLAEKPNFAPAYELLAQISEAGGRNAEGANWREQLQLLDPCYGENPWLLGRYYYWTGYTTPALELLSRQSQCRPVAAASLLQAQILLQRRQTEQAVSLLQDSVRRWPQQAALQAMLAEAYLAQNQPAQAQTIVNKLLAFKPVPPEAHYVQGQLHLRAGRTGSAVSSLKQALSLSSRPEYRKALALAYVQAGMNKQAITELQLYLKQRPTETQALQPLITQLSQQKGRGRF